MWNLQTKDIVKVDLKYSVLNMQGSFRLFFRVVRPGEIVAGSLNTYFSRFFLSHIFLHLLSEKFVWESVTITWLDKENTKNRSELKKITPVDTCGHLDLVHRTLFCFQRKDMEESIGFSIFGTCDYRMFLLKLDFQYETQNGIPIREIEGRGADVWEKWNRSFYQLSELVLSVEDEGLSFRLAGFSNPHEVTEDNPITDFYTVLEPQNFYDTSLLDPQEYNI